MLVNENPETLDLAVFTGAKMRLTLNYVVNHLGFACSRFKVCTASFVLALSALNCASPAEPCVATQGEDGSVTLTCPGQDPVELRPGEQGARGERGLGVALRTEEATLEQCMLGGQVVYSGFDLDENGVLDSGEETQNFLVCRGAAQGAAQTLVVSVQVGADVCPMSGQRIDIGADTDASGSLESEEVTSSFTLCDGVAGPSGESGAAALMEVTIAGASSCAAGGDLIEVGIDLDQDGTLDSDEVTSSFDVCDGQDGSSCTVIDNGDSTRTIECGDGTSVTLSDGQDGSSCSIRDNGDSTRTILCSDGTSADISDGQDGTPGPRGETGMQGDAGNSSLLSISHGAAQLCPSGGDLIAVGVDEDGDGVLASSEVTDTFEVCHGADGSDGVDGIDSRLEIIAGGATSCAAGGDLVLVGQDVNGDGALSGAEVTASFDVCDGETGAQGATGPAGQDGRSALVNTVEGGATTCPNGGDRVDAGVDDDADGVLDASEVDSSVDLCHGVDGMDGVDGTDGVSSLIKLSVEPVGSNCPAGGQKIEVGLDEDGDGVLDVSEVDPTQTAFICSPYTPPPALEPKSLREFCSLFGSGEVRCASFGVFYEVNSTSYAPGVRSLDFGDDASCHVTAAGGARCAGYNLYGSVGNGSVGNGSYTPHTDVVGLTSGVESVEVGQHHTCALMNTGGVKCWGRNQRGQLGDGSFTQSSIPVDVVGLSSGVVQIAAGGDGTCALMNTGALKCWGQFRQGFVGEPVDVPNATSGVRSVDVGSGYACFVTTAGALRCLGSNFAGQLGDGTTTTRNIPVDVVGLSAGVESVSTGLSNTCAVTTAGGVKCWGDNSVGQLGDGTLTGRTSPVDVFGLSSGMTHVLAAPRMGCAAGPSGMFCWGDNSNGRLGVGLEQGNHAVPAEVVFGDPKIPCDGNGDGTASRSCFPHETCTESAGNDVCRNNAEFPCDADRDGVAISCSLLTPAQTCTVGVGNAGDLCI